MGINTPNSLYLTEEVLSRLNKLDSNNIGYWVQLHELGFSNITESGPIKYRDLNAAFARGFKDLYQAAPGNERILIACFNLAVIQPTLEISPRMGKNRQAWLETIRRDAKQFCEERPAFKSIIDLLSEGE